MKDVLTCAFCDKKIADFIDDKLVPDAESLYQSGYIPVPNMGWLCSYQCAVNFEKKYNVKFSRTIDGGIDYYAKG